MTAKKLHAAKILYIESALSGNTDMERAAEVSDLIENSPELAGQALLMLIAKIREETAAKIAADLVAKAHSIASNNKARL